VEPNSSGQVQIVVEEVSQKTLSGATQDEKIRRLLLAAAKDASDPGLRVESVDLLKSSSGSVEVRRALIFALQHDSNPGVRLKALEGLRASAGDAETRKALSAVLLNDDNPGVRTQAIDMLVQKKEAGMVGLLQEIMEREDNEYVRLRCQKALHEMKASIDTF
jgi:HEAT repeat protein